MTKKVAFIFPGQGSQKIGMGKSFVEGSAIAKEMMQKASQASGIDFEKLLFEENTDIDKTENTQPAILLVSLMAHAVFTSKSDIQPTLLLGHSLGEFSAVSAAGALDPIEAVKLVNARGKLMQSACDEIEASMMVVLGLTDDKVEEICQKAQEDGKKVWPANYNQDGQLVVAGMKSDLASMEAIFKEAGAKRAMLLNMSVASHCPILEPAQAPLKEKMDAVLSDSFCAPIVSNVTTAKYDTKVQALELLSEQLVKPVKYKQSIEAIASEIDIAIEFGNGKVLAGMNKRINKEMKTYNIFDMQSLEAVLTELNA
ncbi:ACP S-malonyltransferase [Sulfurimonas sp. MAG313]|nr:ACP S-malonyltransferase [Sulfurimonas sp. MAG313]MDF1879860.1 ACP S-malonyltransferase [Sulfurimonas sp. MAG313]